MSRIAAIGLTLLAAGGVGGCSGGTIARYPYDLFAHGTGHDLNQSAKTNGTGSNVGSDPGPASSPSVGASAAGMRSASPPAGHAAPAAHG